MDMYEASFIGGKFPPNSSVSFVDTNGKTHIGIVQRLLKSQARVATKSGEVYEVPYTWLTLTGGPEPEMPLSEIEDRATELFNQHGLTDSGWKFGFDLSASRGGICRHKQRVITMSMTFCMKAPREEIVNILLHEIAHAMVGGGHGHGRVWKEMAKAIGCNAMRCHTVKHTESKYVGKCGCNDGYVWKRNRLTQKAKIRKCVSCMQLIKWELRKLDNFRDTNENETPIVIRESKPVASDVPASVKPMTYAQELYMKMNGLL